MFIPFLDSLRRQGVPVSLREWLDLMAGMQAGVADWSVDGFYHLARLVLVKDERHIDRFDRAFAEAFSGLEAIPVEALVTEQAIPRDWLEKLAEKLLTDAEKAEIQGGGSFEDLMRKLRERLAEQQGRHQGGSKWIGTAGTSPFGAYGYNPEGVRIGQDESRHRRAVKVWDKREFRDFDDNVELGTRNIKVALKRLRPYPRRGRAVLGRAGRVQTHGAFLFPQLPLRRPVDRQPPPLDRTDADLGCAAPLRARLQMHLRGRCVHVAIRDRGSRRGQ